jgi:hypothetical protein
MFPLSTLAHVLSMSECRTICPSIERGGCRVRESLLTVSYLGQLSNETFFEDRRLKLA